MLSTFLQSKKLNITSFKHGPVLSKRALEQEQLIEMLLQGVDPDAPEDDEDNEVDDADGDQEEAELLWSLTIQHTMFTFASNVSDNDSSMFSFRQE